MTEFQRLYTGRLWSVLAWDQLTALWQRVDPAAGWYLLAVGVAPAPTHAAAPASVSACIERIDALLRAEHHESYCGIVYADDLENPCLIKIYDPNKLGSSCGSSKNPPLPGWIMSRLPPDGILAAGPVPENRKRWWQGLLGDS
ncbi:MAG: hypothetical protein FIA96_05380 [Betaproteobacteria bacterium]|nr:hypothetical protein [Betaproteobacteria bacterium]